MSSELLSFFNDLDLERLRVNRPSKVVFLCGGRTAVANRTAESLRDYIYRVRRIDKSLRGEIVLAEKAVQLYRDTSYSDLITFEEDIARISSVVIVIAESAGSLAELGAFSTNPTIQKSLRVILQTQYEREESFIRFGPVQRVIRVEKRTSVAFFPWRVNRSGRFIQSSASSHYNEIRSFISGHLSAVPSSERYRTSGDRNLFYVIYWVVYLGTAVSEPYLYQYIDVLIPGLKAGEIRNKLFCMELAGWIGRTSYSTHDYFYVLHGVDPFDYSFRQDVADRDSARRKFVVGEALSKISAAPRHVKQLAIASRTRVP